MAVNTTTTEQISTSPQSAAAPRNVFTGGFSALLVTQVLGAVNDNMFKQFLILEVAAGGIWAGRLGSGGPGLITVFFTVPFILFSGWAGQFADRHSKRQVSVWVKLADLPIALCALLALLLGNLWLCVAAMFLLGMQSTVFGPAKYGMIPELFPEEMLGRANGVLNMLTNIAVLAGMILGGWLSDLYPEWGGWLPGLLVLVIAVSSYVSALLLPPLLPCDPKLRYCRDPLTPYLETLRQIKHDKALIRVGLGWCFFYMIAIMVLSATADFRAPLHLSNLQTGVLAAMLGIGIGLGSVAAGYLMKGPAQQVKLIVAGTIGMALALIVIGSLKLAPESATGGPLQSFYQLLICLILLGTAGGLYTVPFQALVQALAPKEARGRVLGTGNFVSFCFVAAGGGAYWLLRGPLNLDVQQALLASSALLVLGVTALVWGLGGKLEGRG